MSLSDGETILASRELDSGYTHAENLHVFVNDCIREAKCRFSDIGAVAVSKGPGSYTGLRIGVSAAKGFAFALGVPLISVDTLQLMALKASEVTDAAVLCPMIDARRMEVYTALYDRELKEVLPVQALIVDENSIEPFLQHGQVAFFGNGMEKCAAVIGHHKNTQMIRDIVPSAVAMAKLSARALTEGRTESVAYFEPFYLKEFIAGKALSASKRS